MKRDRTTDYLLRELRYTLDLGSETWLGIIVGVTAVLLAARLLFALGAMIWEVLA